MKEREYCKECGAPEGLHAERCSLRLRPADRLYPRVLAVITELIAIDPKLMTPEGRLLHHLADAADRYESERYPL